MLRARQLLVLCLGSLLLAGCAGGKGVGGSTGSTTGTIINPAAPKAYNFKCSTPPSVNDWASELNVIQPQARIAPLLQVQLPPAGPDQLSACTNAQYEARIEALRRAKLFDEIIVRHDGMAGFPPPEREEEGYWMWVESSNLVVSYGKSLRWSITNSPQRLDVWVTGLKRFFDNIRTMTDKNSPAISTVSVGTSNYFGYHGVEYIVFSDLRAALIANAEETARKTSKVKETGKSLLILTPPEKAVVDNWTKSVKNVNIANGPGNIGLITGTSTYVTTLGQAQAIERSGLFRKTTIREEDATDPDTTGYDAVLWIRSTDSGKWYLHMQGHKTLQFKNLSGTEPDKWIERVTEAIADARADKVSAEIDPPAAAKKPLTFSIDGTVYSSLDQVTAALKTKCDKLVDEIAPSGNGRYASLLLVLPTRQQQTKNVVNACLPKPGTTGPVKCEQSDDEKNAVTGFMNAINDSGNDCLATAIQKSALFKSVSVAREREVAEGDFEGQAYKMMVRPMSAAGPAGWTVAAQRGGTQFVPGVPALSLAKSGDEKKMLQALEGALDKLH